MPSGIFEDDEAACIEPVMICRHRSRQATHGRFRRAAPERGKALRRRAAFMRSHQQGASHVATVPEHTALHFHHSSP
jgi:hypothetical protein